MSRRTPKPRRLAEWEVIAQAPAVQEALKLLPQNYDFELAKTLWKIVSIQAKTVVLQFPEGLLMFSCIIADIIRRFTGAEVTILAEVTYGACCVDDFAAVKVGADLLVHYGHSCLVPVQDTKVKTMYVFVGIRFNTEHLIQMIKTNFPADKNVAILGTVQFLSALGEVQQACTGLFQNLSVPQVKPLSRGETLGCTAPSLPENTDLFIFLADGRFHMEAVMIRNPKVPVCVCVCMFALSFMLLIAAVWDVLQGYRYDPYNKVMSLERYDHARMLQVRQEAVEIARSARVFGIILGTLGHQGNPRILQRLKEQFTRKKKCFVVFLMAEVQLSVLASINSVDAWVQISCPRLSIDWGADFPKVSSSLAPSILLILLRNYHRSPC